MGYNPWMSGGGMGLGMLSQDQSQGQNGDAQAAMGQAPTAPSAIGDVGSGAMSGSAFGPYGALIGAGVGLANYVAIQKPQYERQLGLAANTQRLAPITGLKANTPQPGNPLGSALSMGSAGAQLGQNYANAKQQNTMNNAYLQYLQSFSPGKGSAAPTTTGGYSSGYGLPAAPYAPQQPNLPPGYLQYGGWYGGGGDK